MRSGRWGAVSVHPRTTAWWRWWSWPASIATAAWWGRAGSVPVEWRTAAASSRRWGTREFTTGQDDGDVDDGAVELGFMHVRDGRFGLAGGVVENVGCASVRHDCMGGIGQLLWIVKDLRTHIVC